MGIFNNKHNGGSGSLSPTSATTSASDRIYTGQDLTQVNASEIAGYSDVWAWAKARIQAGNFTNIHVGDYIPFAMSAGTVTDGKTPYTFTAQNFKAVVAGIDCYSSYVGVGKHHIDFITETVCDKHISYQTGQNGNNGASELTPWMSSVLYAMLNGINNYSTTGYGSHPMGYAIQSGSVLSLLPATLQSVIQAKSITLGTRYDTTKVLTNDVIDQYSPLGKLWVPSEFEVFGSQCYCSKFSCLDSVQYPLFANSSRLRAKTNSTGTNFQAWLMLNPIEGYSDKVNCCDNKGCDSYYPVGAACNFPICFRIA